MKHVIGHENLAESLVGSSGWGAQFVAGGDYALTRSGRLRAGLTARYYYIGVGYRAARILTLGPDFAFSFR